MCGYDLLANSYSDVEYQPVTPRLYSLCEGKVLDADFILVRYNRENKTVQRSYDNPAAGWAPAIQFNTYAAAERTLKEMLAIDNVVETSLDGKINMSTSAKKLWAAGFDFFRMRGDTPGSPEAPRIVQGRSNWSTWRKFETIEQMLQEWNQVVMADNKALKG
jgi:hypothetical protein